jgi:hypothetical protein
MLLTNLLSAGLVDETIPRNKCRREPAWTESIVVGSKDFAGAIEEATVHRSRFETEAGLMS